MSRDLAERDWRHAQRCEAERGGREEDCTCGLTAWRSALLAESTPAAPDEEGLVRGIVQVRDFLMLHREATGRSDVNIRKVVALLDELLFGEAARAPAYRALASQDKA